MEKKRTTITKDPKIKNSLSRLYQEKGRRSGERYKLWGLKAGEFSGMGSDEWGKNWGEQL